MATDEVITQRNFQIVLDALQRLEEPVTLTNVVNFVAETQHMSSSEIKEPIKQILQSGIDCGFVKKMGAKYAINSAPPSPSSSEADENDEGEQMDRARRRRGGKRSRSRGRRKSRSRSRRR